MKKLFAIVGTKRERLFHENIFSRENRLFCKRKMLSCRSCNHDALNFRVRKQIEILRHYWNGKGFLEFRKPGLIRFANCREAAKLVKVAREIFAPVSTAN